MRAFSESNLSREPGRLVHLVDDPLLVAGQELDREAESADREREQERREAGEARHPAPKPLHPGSPGGHAGLPEKVLTVWTRAANSLFLAIHAASQRRTPAASRSAAVSNSGRPITPGKAALEARDENTRRKALDRIGAGPVHRLAARPVIAGIRRRRSRGRSRASSLIAVVEPAIVRERDRGQDVVASGRTSAASIATQRPPRPPACRRSRRRSRRSCPRRAPAIGAAVQLATPASAFSRARRCT